MMVRNQREARKQWKLSCSLKISIQQRRNWYRESWQGDRWKARCFTSFCC